MTSLRSAFPILVTSAMLILLVADPVRAQGFQWPEKAENLKVLPESIDSRQLRDIMIGFSRALGVRCSHCHVGEPDAPLSEYDFPADDKQTKATAREMLKMVRHINEEHLAGIEPTAERVVVTCITCHRGQNKPRLLEDVLAEVIEAEGIRAGVGKYRELRERHYGGFTYDFSENVLNTLGYRLMNEDKLEEAISIFRLNIEMYPDSSNPYDSLGEAYLKASDRRRARIFYQKSLELNPDNRNALRVLSEMDEGSASD